MKKNGAKKPDLHKNKEKQKTPWRDKAFPMACIAPSFVGVMIFFLVPFAVVLFYSVIDNPFNKEFVMFDNFVSLMKNSSFRKAALNTLMFSLTSVPLAVILGLGLALLLDAKIPLVSQFRASFLCPMMVPVASVVLIWQVIFHYNGSLNDFLSKFGVDKIDWFKSDKAMIVVALLFLWKNLGYNMILFLSALGSVSKDQLEVATLEGASGWYKFVHIKLRHLSPTILFVAILSLINSFKVFREVYLLTGDHPYDTIYMLQHFMNNMFRRLDYQKLSAAAIIMSIVVIVILAALFFIESKFGEDTE